MARTEKLILKSGTLFKNEESNEITTSLKLFAARALKEQDYSDFRTPIEDITRDFENNGVSVDEFKNLRDERDLMSPARGKVFNKLRNERDLLSPAKEKDSCGTSKGTKKAPKKKSSNANSHHCVFCENNKEPYSVVRSHAVRDMLGRVVCPKLRSYKCPLCHAFGDNAHTVKYCPKRPIITMEDTILAQRLGKLYPFTNIISILNV